jgi:hypothetical protein
VRGGSRFYIGAIWLQSLTDWNIEREIKIPIKPYSYSNKPCFRKFNVNPLGFIVSLLIDAAEL